MRRLVESRAITIEQLAALHGRLGVTTAADLLAAVRGRAVRRVPGLDASVERAIARALPALRTTAPAIPLGRAVAIAEPFLERLRRMADVTWAEPVGSLRRGQELVGDIEIVAPAIDPQPVFDDLTAQPDIARSVYRSGRRLYLMANGVQIGIRVPRAEKGGATLLNLTGSPSHVDQLTALAAERGWRLGPDGLCRDDESPADRCNRGRDLRSPWTRVHRTGAP